MKNKSSRLRIVIITGAIFIIMGGRFLPQELASKTWPRVQGNVTMSKMKITGTGGTRSRTAFIPLVQYEFELNGEKYLNDVFWPSNNVSMDREYVQQIAAKYHRGDKIWIYYMPSNPKNSCIEPRICISSALFPILGLFIIVLGIKLITGKSEDPSVTENRTLQL